MVAVKRTGAWQDWLREKVKKLQGLRYPLLVLVLGAVLLLIPGKQEERQKTPASTEQVKTDCADANALETRLAELLSQVEGAGRVEVVLSIGAEGETCYQTDSRTEQDGSGGEHSEISTVLVDGTGSTQTPLIRQQSAPEYRGAVILSQGAENPAVRLALVEAVADLTGLSTDRISVMKMK